MISNFDKNDAAITNSANADSTSAANASTTGKKQSSQRRLESSRANGRKSRGPVTPEGKARSSQNSRRHGALATLITLTPEDEHIFNLIFEQYANRFQPRDQPEFDLVEEITFYKFQIRQCWIQQASALKLQMTKDKDIVDSEWAGATEHERRVLALSASTKDGNTIVLLQRYARTLSTQAERAIKQLLDLQKLRLPPVPAPSQLGTDRCPLTTDVPNDPSPEIEQCDDSQLTADHSPMTAAVFAYSSPAARVAPVYTPQPRLETTRQTALLARAA
jgi:hypothetical protein